VLQFKPVFQLASPASLSHVTVVAADDIAAMLSSRTKEAHRLYFLDMILLIRGSLIII